MSGAMHVTEELAAYALGCLDEAEARQVREHLAVCAECRAELASYEAVTDKLALAAPEVAPPARLRQRLMAHIQPARRPAAAASWWESLSRLFRRSAPAWALASLVLVVALVTSNVLWLQAGRGRPAGEMRTLTLRSTAAAPGATGMLVMSPNGEYGTLVVDGLPTLELTQQYQLWLVHEGERVSGGVFSVGGHGYGALVVYAPAPLSLYDSFDITIEPAGGSPEPTGPQVLSGSSF